MKIMLLHGPRHRYAATIVAHGLARSFTWGQVSIGEYGKATQYPSAVVLIHPEEGGERLAAELAENRRKILILGRPGIRWADRLGLRMEAEGADPVEAGHSAAWGESPWAVRYQTDHPLGRMCPFSRRPLCRYDFADEWNNLGYGRISLAGDCWSLAERAICDDRTCLAWIEDETGRVRGTYAALADSSDAAVLWFNRAVGPVDSLEWQIVESFFGDYRPGGLPCFPYLAEVPAGYAGAVIPRLDCDEAIESARSLWELYATRGVPLSLAVPTGLKMGPRDLALLREAIANGGSVLSHSHSHPPSWGGSYAAARREAETSRHWLESQVPAAAPVRHAVSPFHQNPVYAVRALADSGYQGFIGGIIRNDPEYLLGRAGQVPFATGIVSQSQQCMLHGDCYHRAGRSIHTYVESFDNHLRGRAIFGYLDHPFSARYQYGWGSEAERVGVHARFLDHIQARPGLWYANLKECLEFVRQRAQAVLNRKSDAVFLRCPPGCALEIRAEGEVWSRALEREEAA